MNEYNIDSLPMKVKNRVLHESKSIMDILAEPNMQKFLNNYCDDVYQRVQNKYDRLKNQEYRIAVAAGQSAGKSSVVNSFVLEYPLLPFCDVVTTCVPTIIKYSKDIKLKVTVNEMKEENGRKKIKEVRNFSVYCTNEYISREMFDQLVNYFAICYKALALGNVRYFTKKPIEDYNGTITANDLTLSYDNPKHIAMLLLTVLCAYMENNESEEHLTKLKIDARRTQQELLSRLGLKEDEKNYSVTLYWDTPLLKKGLVFYDLPGLGSDNYANNGYESHEEITKTALEEVQSMLYIFKKEATEEGLNAISTLLNMESIKELKSKQNRVIVALNKADTLDGQAGLNASIDKARMSMDKFHINPKIYPISAQIYGEDLYVKKGYTNITNIKTIRAIRKFLPEDGLMEALQAQLKNHPGTDFYNALNDYADRAIVTNTLEYLKSLHQLVSKASKEIVNVINLYRLVGEDVSNAGDEVQKLIKSLSVDILNTFKINSQKDIEEGFWKIEKNSGYEAAIDQLMSDLDKEMSELNEWSTNYVKNNLQTNKFKHIVLYRNRKTGIVYEEPNYSNWTFMNCHIKNYRFKTAFTNFTVYLKKLIEMIQSNCLSLNKTLIDDLNDEFDNIDKKIKSRIEDVKEKLLMDIKKNTKNQSQIEAVYNQTLDILYKLCGYYKQYTQDCVDDINKSLTETDNVEKLNEELVNRATELQNELNNEFVRVTSSLADNLKKTGKIRKKTYVVKKDELLKFINETLIFNEVQKNIYILTLNPESLVKNFCDDGEEGKKSSIEAPIKNLKIKLDNMQEILTPKSGDEFINLHEAIKSYIDMLAYLNKGLLASMNIGDVTSDIKEVYEYKNEISNFEDISFDKLQLEVQRNLDKIKEESD